MSAASRTPTTCLQLQHLTNEILDEFIGVSSINSKLEDSQEGHLEPE